MKKRFVMLAICLLAAAMLLAGCSAEMGYIVRTDIQFEDLGFVLKGNEFRTDVTEEDMVEMLGWPYDKDDVTSGYEYTYFFEDERCGEGTMRFIFTTNGHFYGIGLDTEKETPSTDELVENGVLDPNQYKRPMRNDITEEELSFINESTLVTEIQDKLGAAHDTASLDEEVTRTSAFLYPLTNGKVFAVTYERGGVIVKAWLVDKNGKELSVIVDRTAMYSSEDNE